MIIINYTQNICFSIIIKIQINALKVPKVKIKSNRQQNFIKFNEHTVVTIKFV